MQYTYPDYYSKFRCEADKCEDTCCASWQIVIDNNTLNKYKKISGGFGNRLRNSIDINNSSFKQYNHRCAFLNDNNLCDIYTEAGPDMLCNTCKRYPRHIEEYEDLREVSLSLSCPVAARIILNNENKVCFITKEKNNRDEEYKNFDYLLFTKLMDSRDYIFEILQNRSISLHDRCGIVLAFSHDLQTRIDKKQLFDVDELISRYGKNKTFSWFNSKLKKDYDDVEQRYNISKAIFESLYDLEVLNYKWPPYLKKHENILFGQGLGHYKKTVEQFEKCIEEGKIDFNWDIAMEQILVYFIFVYFCGSIYDKNQFSKMQLAITSYIIIKDICMSQIADGEIITMNNLIKITHSYAKEVEHSDVNLCILEGKLNLDITFDLYNLLMCI